MVLLHGGPGAPGAVAPLARMLVDEFRVLEPLQRRSGTVPLTVEQHVADLADVAPTESVLVGCSWGAMLALSYAAAHPDRVRGVVLVGCGTYDVESRAVYQARMRRSLAADGTDEAERLRREIEDATTDEERDVLMGRLGDLAERAQSHEPLDVPDEVVRCDMQGQRETWDDVLRLQDEGREPLAFAAISAPVVMIHGADDPHPGRATHDVLSAFVPRLEYVELDRCGHQPWIERHARAEFLEVLRDHLRTLTSIPAS